MASIHCAIFTGISSHGWGFAFLSSSCCPTCMCRQAEEQPRWGATCNPTSSLHSVPSPLLCHRAFPCRNYFYSSHKLEMCNYEFHLKEQSLVDNEVPNACPFGFFMIPQSFCFVSSCFLFHMRERHVLRTGVIQLCQSKYTTAEDTHLCQ